jgi:hypothetical protein
MAVIMQQSFKKFFGTAAECAAFASAALGDRFFETDTRLMKVWTGAAWVTDAEDTLSLSAGSAIIGKVGIDQTTDGTTNKVQARNATHDNFNANANLQVGDADVGAANPVPVSMADGANVSQGAKADAAATIADATPFSVIALLKGIFNRFINLGYGGAALSVSNPFPVKGRFRQSAYVIPAFDILAWSGFTNQPDGDDVEIISNSASDVGKCTIFYTKKSDGTFTHTTVTLTGTNAKALTGANDVDDVLGIVLGDIDGQNITPAVGTITIREASGGQAITTIAATKISKGMVALDFGGKDVIYRILSGNAWKNTAAVVTAANGFKMESGDARDEFVSGHLYLISDTSGASCSIDVLAD